MAYHPRQEAGSEDAVTFLNAELHTNVKEDHDRQGVLTRESEPIAIEADMAFTVTNCKNR